MKETVQFRYYPTVDGVRCKAYVNRTNLEVFERDKEGAREAMIVKARKVLTDNAEECEEVEIKY